MADVETLIVGGGVSGICMAIQLLKAGRASFLVVEKSGEVGGTWSLNKYPGCACDVPSHLYSFSFSPNPSWSQMYAPGHEIHAYLQACSHRHAILPHFRFHTLALAAAWDESAALWRIHLQDTISSQASSISARFLVRAVGILHLPKFPSIEGMEKFAGPSFHSSAWDSSVDLHGKTIAIIGTGASAIQIAPNVATIAKKLYVCQRTPMWILPKLDFLISNRCKCFFRKMPFFMKLFSWLIFIFHEILVLVFLDWKTIRRCLEKVAKKHMEKSIKDVKMRNLLMPRYKMGCKRLLLSNSFYPTLTRPNVELMASPILEIQKHNIVFGTNSSSLNDNVNVDVDVDVDVIIYATGFDIYSTNFEVIGKSGLAFSKAGFSSMLGTTKQGFPNCFTLYGYNTTIGHTSVILMIEAQVRYTISCMSLMTPMTRSLELCNSSEKHYEDLLARRFQQTVWHTGGCKSWYLDPKDGKQFVIWPSSTIEYIYRSWHANPLDYHFE